MKKKKKKGMVTKLRLLPLYWKVIGTIAIFGGGGCLASQLVTSGSDVGVFTGIILAVLALWLLINMWLPTKETNPPKKHQHSR